MLDKVAALGQPAVAMTDHGNLHGAIEFYTHAKEKGVKPIVGCELYVTPGSRYERKTRKEGGAGTHHVTALVKNLTGYRNLCKLVTLAYKEGFYFKPRVDHELLTSLSEGIVILSGCMNGELGYAAVRDDLKTCRKVIEYYASVFKDNYYLEIQPHPIPEQRRVNEICADLAKSYGIPLVATTDCHYLNADDHYAQEVLMCISTGTNITDPQRMRHQGLTLHLKTLEEMQNEFGALPYVDEALRNTVEISKGCDLDFDFNKYYMPRYDLPEGESLDQAMAKAARKGLEERLQVIRQVNQNWGSVEESQYQDRLEQEIKMISEMGFAGYFLICADFIVWAKSHGVPVGPGRGSAAGSLVAFCMRITDVDPIQHKLLFERFLNPKRVSLPDIDVDFCINGRDRVIEYVVSKYGKDRVAQIATFGSMKAKAAIKDVGRVLGKSFAEMDKIAQLVPAPRQGFDYPLTEAIKMEKRLSDFAQGEGRDIIQLALHVEGLPRHASTHAAGVVIGDRPLTELLPLMVDKAGNDVTQYSMKYVEKIGLLKFDFLGLKTLTVIHTALALIKESTGFTIELDKLPLDDAKTYTLLCAGNTTGVFQLESGGITEMTMRLKPSCFDDLVAILALYRPGPLDAGMVDHYIRRKHGQEVVSYPHARMRVILADTYGIIIYQEQIMQLAQELAGYSLGEADLLRRAMGKKNPEEMRKQRDKFVDGAVARKIEKRMASEIFDQMETFARYGFNRSHSAAYAMVSFHTGYLKAHYPVEFMAALMSHEMDDSDKTLKNMTECRKQKIKILPPDVNQSVAGFSVRKGAIRFGLSALKGIGDKAVESIEKVRREQGAFEDLEDFTKRVDLRVVNRRVMESLIKCGAFDFSSISRREMIENLDAVLQSAQIAHEAKNSNQISLFGGGEIAPIIRGKKNRLPEWPVNQRLSFEREALGFYISGHPLEKYQKVLKQMGALTSTDIRALKRGGSVIMGGVVTALKLKNTKKGDRYATFLLEDAVGSVEAIVWPDIYTQQSSVLAGEEPVLASARADITDERCVLIIEKIQSLIDLRDRKATQGLLAFDQDDMDSRLDKLFGILSKHNGNCPVKVRIKLAREEVWVTLKDKRERPVCVVPSETLCEEVEQLFGRPILSFV